MASKEEKKDLFESDDDSSSDNKQSSKPEGVSPALQINQKYASAYKARKQRQELKRNVEFDLDHSDESSSSSSEDEDGDRLLPPAMDVQILKTINAIRNKDDSIYDPNTRFFTEQGSSSKNEKTKTTKVKHYKDVVREQILEQMQEEENDGDSKKHSKKESLSRLAYDEQQQELRKAFLDQGDSDNDDDEDWMKIKETSKENDEDAGQAQEELMEELDKMKKSSKQASKLVDPRGEIEDGENFLLNFIKNKQWVDKSGEERGAEDSDDQSEASLDALEKADDFEAQYNFRFEEQAAAAASGADYSMVGYARSQTMNTLRRPDDTRKQKRMARKERKAAERKAKEEELRRLKNAKREEMERKIKQIKNVVGVSAEKGEELDEAALMKLLEGDYDPDKFEELMRTTYGDDFYERQDAQWKNDSDVRESLQKGEDGDTLIGHDDEAGGLYDNEEEQDEEYEESGYADDEWYDEEGEGDDAEEDGKVTEVEKKLKEKMMEEMYKLDYEDIVAGMPTRFKYRQVEANDYGLSAEEILLARDTSLKQYVSLKKMAPYSEGAEYRVSGNKRRRFREMLSNDISEQEEELKKAEKEKAALSAAQDAEVTSANKKKKKRRRLKKKKAKDDSTSEDATGAPVPPVGDTEMTSTSADAASAHEEPVGDTGMTSTEKRPNISKSKRRRKKKTGVDSNEENATEVNGAAAVAIGNQTLSEKDKERKKAKKQKKKAKKKTVEGMTASRLASYGF